MRPLSRLAPLALVAGLAGPGALAVVAPAPAYAAEKVGCSTAEPGEDTPSTDVSAADDEKNPALQALRLDDVHTIATGRGVGVAVIDSGVQTSSSLAPRPGTSFVGGANILDGHGTIVAGLIAGQGDTTSIAPGAYVVPVRVSASEPDQDDPQPGSVEPGNVAQAIRWVVDQRRTKDPDLRVINLSLGFAERNLPDVAKAVEAAEDAGIVVVAAAGNRPSDSTEDPDEAESSEEADKPEKMPDEVLFPATLETVIAVTARDEDLAMTTDAVYAGPEIDVSAPVVGLRSVMLGGLLCDIPVTASSWATAEVSGLAALLFEQDPTLTPAQVRTRIELTAQGGFQDSATDGHGMIQPYQALTTVLDIAKDGTLREDSGSRREEFVAGKPDVRGDAYASSREHLVWWGVGAGGAVLLVLILRPLTARRRG
ncbi:S8 family serine peptidase [Nocardioides sp. JQ2195]|uniref:S8 family serine peptidase n=1 Tax=Nocardioides sp. JQ2195 TaxID=2592334 RepID=UPI00143E8663|nr:S8 family serine peptidase [Nocardioides sp. JQ2195]QIX28282.1 S8 family serine peptidase [Nocardioides sp. JQ2195]